MSWATIARNADYHSELVMWRDAVKKYPNNSRSHYSLGCALAADGLADDAISEYQKSLAINAGLFGRPMYTTCWASRCTRRRRTTWRQREFEKSLEISPKFANAHANLAAVLKEQGKTAEAARERKKAGEPDAKP